jgi:aminomuconate-semialdehyde/2-hydroxymuconate-6-semialdehyde dehydrogenase
MMPNEFLNYIDGEFSSSQSHETFEKLNPFTGESLGKVTASNAMDVVRAIQAAKRAQAEIEKWTLEQRSQLLSSIAKNLAEKADAYAYAEALHQGLPKSFVREKSVDFAIHAFANPVVPSTEHVQPSGIVSIILSWNLSLRILSERIAAAVAAGNVCLVKVSEYSPITAHIMGEVLSKSKAPQGLVQLIQGKGPEVGAVLAAHPSVRAVNFVGKLANAEKIVQAATPNFKKIQIHAGTKNSCFVLADSEFATRMPKILESFLIGQGQLGWNTTRLFILESTQAEFFEKIKLVLSAQRPATSPDSESLWFPMISAEAVDEMEKKTQQLKIEGGKFVCGGERARGAGFFFQPTFSLDLSNCSELQQDEVHGPLLIVTAVKYSHEMVKWSNTGYYGHSAVIWGSPEKALKVAEKLDVGTVSCNQWLPAKMQAGHRQSAFGNLETDPWGRFYSDVKVLTGFET